MTNELPPFPSFAPDFRDALSDLEKYQNALAFIFDAIIDEERSFHDLQDLDRGSIDEFGCDFDFDIPSYHLAINHLALIRAS